MCQKKNTLICLQDRPWHFQTLIKSLQRLSGRQISNKNSHKFILFFFPFLLCHAILDEDNLNTLLAWTIFFNMWHVKCKRLEMDIKLTRILLIAATISTLLLGLGTSSVPMYCGWNKQNMALKRRIMVLHHRHVITTVQYEHAVKFETGFRLPEWMRPDSIQLVVLWKTWKKSGSVSLCIKTVIGHEGFSGEM